MTIPNVILNLPDFQLSDEIENQKEYAAKSLHESSSFYSGDWEGFDQLLFSSQENKKFSFIITSETIYNSSCYDKLINVITNSLALDGMAYPFYNIFYMM